jgi:hypothetical protein
MKFDLRPILALAIALLIFIPGAYGISFGGGISTSTSGYSQGNTVVAGQSLNSIFGSSGSTVDKNYYVKDLDSKYAEIKLHYEGGTVTGYGNVFSPKSGNVFSKPTQVSAEQKFTALNAKLIRAQEKASNKAGALATTSIEVTQGGIQNYDGKATTTATIVQTDQTIGDASGASVRLKEDATYGTESSHIDTLITSVNGFGANFKGTTQSKAGASTSASLTGQLAGALMQTGKANSVTKTRNSNGAAVASNPMAMTAQTSGGTATVGGIAQFNVNSPLKIQDAVNTALDGDVVNVLAGTYLEAVNINKQIHLIGAGETTTTANSFTLSAPLVIGSGGITAPLVNVNPGAKIQNGVLLAYQGGKVNVAAGLYKENVVINDKRLSIIGAGQGNTIVDGSLGAPGSGSVFYVGSGSDVDLSGMTIQGGTGSFVTTFISEGGGICNLGILKVSSSTISHNSANYGGGVNNHGIATIIDSTISSNVATSDGGGIDNEGGIVTITDSTISSNEATGFGGGIINIEGDLLIDGNTKIRYNQADYPDGVYGIGGGIFTAEGTLRFAGTSEVSYNKAKQLDSEPNWYTGWGVFSEPILPTTITFGPGWNPTDYVFGNSKLT